MWHPGFVAPWHVGSSWTRARTHVSCIGRRILNHSATREVPEGFFLQRRSSLVWDVGLCVQPTVGKLFLALQAQGGSRCPCLRALCVFCSSLPGCSRVPALSLPFGTERLGLGLGCWCNSPHQGLSYVLQVPKRNLYPHKRASRSQQIQLSGI